MLKSLNGSLAAIVIPLGHHRVGWCSRDNEEHGVDSCAGLPGPCLT